jgi:hypothetical protein
MTHDRGGALEHLILLGGHMWDVFENDLSGLRATFGPYDYVRCFVFAVQTRICFQLVIVD